MDYNRGSEWRRWDLHVHTASSYDTKYRGDDSDMLLVQAWRKHNFAAVAITDHFLIDADRILNLRKLAPEITIFPGFEMRTDKGAPNIHVIGIFPETCDLITLKNDFDAILIRQYKKDNETEQTIVRDLAHIHDFVKRHNGILTVHAGKKTNGLDKEITNALEVSQAIKEEIANVVDMFEIGHLKDVESYRNNVFTSIKEKPLILCSDNHDPRNYDLKDYLWIKANPTFRGLIQTTMQPSERVFIGTMPDMLDKLDKNKSHYIKNISISKVINPSISLENWFDTSMDLNPSLITIIGNKGSGKSAFSDILGHMCKSKNMSVASFLNDERFRKRPEKKANDYVASMEWYDGKMEKDIPLGTARNDISLEDAQYLPQKYIEKVCNDLKDEFQTEIDKVIFSYMDPVEKGNASDLAGLMEKKTISIQNRIIELKNKLEICNKEIIKLEEKKTSQYISTIRANLNKCKEHLERHEENKPMIIEKPEIDNSAHNDKLNSIQDKIDELKNEEQLYREQLTALNTHIDQNKNLCDEFRALTKKIEFIKEQLSTYVNTYDLSIDVSHLSYEIPLNVLEDELQEMSLQKEKINRLLDDSETATDESISKKIQQANAELELLTSEASIHEKSYQKYIDDLKEWEATRNEIIGGPLKDNSIGYFEHMLKYITQELDNEYAYKLNERRLLVSEIYEQKQQSAKIYHELYISIEKKLIPLLKNIDDAIEFTVSINLKEKNIGSKLLSHINQQMSGIFKGKADASAQMDEYIKATNFNDLDSVVEFINNVLLCISEDLDKSSLKVKEKIEFYNLLFSLDYIDAGYSLTLGTRPLEMLSPGERGIVLLVFYLALNRDNTPLIIDQPEDNLDNQSIYSKLVPCIQDAKKRRQVIIVTHNPNIAIACDAEQIICCSIDRSDNHITYSSGSIEDKNICKTVIDILEGTMPAFELRKLKYAYGIK